MYSRKPLRIRGFDYASENRYLVTVSTCERRCFLGTIDAESLVLSPFGEVVRRQIELLPRRLVGVHVDAFVVMPNHVHAIVVLERAGKPRPYGWETCLVG